MEERMELPPPTILPDGSMQLLPPPGEGKAYVINEDLTYSIVPTYEYEMFFEAGGPIQMEGWWPIETEYLMSRLTAPLEEAIAKGAIRRVK